MYVQSAYTLTLHTKQWGLIHNGHTEKNPNITPTHTIGSLSHTDIFFKSPYSLITPLSSSSQKCCLKIKCVINSDF